jgi:hypothetical protein
MQQARHTEAMASKETDSARLTESNENKISYGLLRG